jgi:hypothetical protein
MSPGAAGNLTDAILPGTVCLTVTSSSVETPYRTANLVATMNTRPAPRPEAEKLPKSKNFGKRIRSD